MYIIFSICPTFTFLQKTRDFNLINLMFIRIYMNILIYNQERRKCTMQKKPKKTHKNLYIQINK